MAVSWFWSGAQSPDGFTVTVKLTAGATSCRLMVDTVNTFPAPSYSAAAAPNATFYVKLTIAGLAPDTLYFYRCEIDGVPDVAMTGEAETFPVAGVSTGVVFASASCSETASNHAVFTSIRDKRPLFFCHVGDKHYGASTSTDPAVHVAFHNTGMSTANQKAMYQVVPAPYTWDDHDYGPNNADATSAGRIAANQAYRQIVPSHDLVRDDYGIYHYFDVGRIRFILTDTRTFRSPDTDPDGRGKSMLGWTQRDWFLDLITTSSQDGTRAIVWANSQQWSIEENPPAAVDPNDCWWAFAYERSLIARHMRHVGCPPVVIVSGDAHEIALRREYINSGMSFMVTQNAALDRSANTRYDYWDNGPVPGRGHYGLLTITDDGDTVLTVEHKAYEVSAGGVDTVLWTEVVDLYPRIILRPEQAHHRQRRTAA